MNTHEYCYQPRSRLDHAPGEDTDAPTNVATGRALGDDDVGSVSTVCSDRDSGSSQSVLLVMHRKPWAIHDLSGVLAHLIPRN